MAATPLRRVVADAGDEETAATVAAEPDTEGVAVRPAALAVSEAVEEAAALVPMPKALFAGPGTIYRVTPVCASKALIVLNGKACL